MENYSYLNLIVLDFIVLSYVGGVDLMGILQRDALKPRGCIGVFAASGASEVTQMEY